MAAIRAATIRTSCATLCFRILSWVNYVLSTKTIKKIISRLSDVNEASCSLQPCWTDMILLNHFY